MHKAAGGRHFQHPTLWVKSEAGGAFIDSVSKTCENPQVINVIRGKGKPQGVYAHWQIALAYAKYLSPELHMEVNKTYMRYKAADPNLALEVIDKQKDVEVLAHIEARTRAKKNYIGLTSTVFSQGGGETTIAGIATAILAEL